MTPLLTAVATSIRTAVLMLSCAVGCLQDYRDLDILTDCQDQLYAAVCFSVINSVEKVQSCPCMAASNVLNSVPAGCSC
jgi:hypothetical protein